MAIEDENKMANKRLPTKYWSIQKSIDFFKNKGNKIK